MRDFLRNFWSGDKTAGPLVLWRNMAKQFLVSSERSSVPNLFGSDVVSTKRVVVDNVSAESHAQLVVLFWLQNQSVPSIVNRSRWREILKV
jgi:hypothetical protein